MVKGADSSNSEETFDSSCEACKHATLQRKGLPKKSATTYPLVDHIRYLHRQYLKVGHTLRIVVVDAQFVTEAISKYLDANQIVLQQPSPYDHGQNGNGESIVKITPWSQQVTVPRKQTFASLQDIVGISSHGNH